MIDRCIRTKWKDSKSEKTNTMLRLRLHLDNIDLWMLLCCCHFVVLRM